MGIPFILIKKYAICKLHQNNRKIAKHYEFYIDKDWIIVILDKYLDV